jgi:salicylate hydroxylase
VRTTDKKEYSADVLIGASRHACLVESILMPPLAGADGIRSAVRPFVTGSSAPPSPSGESAYRAYVPVEALRELGHPFIAGGALAPHTSGIMGGTRRIIAYPVRGGTLLNLVCYVPDLQLTEATSERWTAQGDTAALLDAFASFAQPWRDMLACVPVLHPALQSGD